MSRYARIDFPGTAALAAALALGLLPPAAIAAAVRAVSETRAADPQGRVDVVNVSGHVEVQGWERAEVQVSGTLGERVERLDVTTEGNRTTVRVVLPSGNSDGRGSGDAQLVVRVPAGSALTTSLVSAGLVVRGVHGSQELQTVSGDVTADGARDMQVRTVSGNVRLGAKSGDAGRLEIRTVSGDVRVTGSPAGEVDVNTVSGEATLDLGVVRRGRFKSVSGNYTLNTGLGGDGRLDVESVSGDVRLTFGTQPQADFDVETFSGAIDNCFGPKAVEPRYGPGSRLAFREGQGHARVHVDTKSGDVRLCTQK